MSESLVWTLGLIASNGKYLTAEQFGFKINAAGSSLRKKQTFTLEQDGNNSYFKSYLGKYLAANEKGEFTASSDSKGKNEAFNIIPQADGRWVIQGAHGYYFGGSGDALHVFARDIGETEKWAVQLAIHPQVTFRNVNRKTYVHLEDGELRCNEVIPWGDDALITLEFQPSGKYSLRACNGKFLSKDGSLSDDVNDNALFILEFFESKIALKANDGKYLQGYGAKGTMRTRNNVIGKDELFELEDSHPQFTLKANNGRYVSNGQTAETKADQQKVRDTEIYQIEHAGGNNWWIRSSQNLYLRIASNSSVEAAAANRDEAEAFAVTWMGPHISLTASNGKIVNITPGGQLKAAGSSIDDSAKFIANLINRPQLILRSQWGFVDHKASGSRLTCNNVDPDVFQVSVEDGLYTFKGENGKYLATNPDGSITANSSKAEQWHVELPSHSRIAIRAANRNYLKGDQAGVTKAVAKSVDAATHWEF